MAKFNKNLYQNISTFHSDNLFIPKRIVYFGSNDTNSNDNTDEVNPYNVGQLIKNLLILDNQNHQSITLMLNTCGGSWEDGMSLYDVIRSLKSKVNIIGLGKIYSMGSIIIQAGNKRLLTQNSLFLIHDGTEGFSGDSKSYEAWAKISKENRITMYKIFYDRIKSTGKKISLQEIEEMCGHDTILSAKEAVKLGFADSIVENKG
jgi:ATP-dependent Clp protease, protease subunit